MKKTILFLALAIASTKAFTQSVIVSSANITCTENVTTLNVTGTLEGEVTGYTIELMSGDGNTTRIVTNQIAQAGGFQYNGAIPGGVATAEPQLTSEQAVDKAYRMVLMILERASKRVKNDSDRREVDQYLSDLKTIKSDAARNPASKVQEYLRMAKRCVVLDNSSTESQVTTDFSESLAATSLRGPFHVKVFTNRQQNHRLDVEFISACQ